MATEVFAFEVRVAGKDWAVIINARSSGQAKFLFWRENSPDFSFTEIRVRKLGAPQTPESFIHTAKYRGLPDARCGQRVRVGDATGVIVGSNSSANFDVLFDTDSPRYAGLRLNVHPQEIVFTEGAGA